jgi:hypothetical protein
MMSYDKMEKNPTVIWNEMPTVIRSDSSDAVRVQLLYAWLYMMKMDGN